MKTMNRKELLTSLTRGVVLTGIVGVAVVLNTREEKFECSNRCGTCPKNEDGMCQLGLR
jgi:hypothetical protein